MFLWTKISPGREAVTTLSGTRESAHPIQRTYIPREKKISNSHPICEILNIGCEMKTPGESLGSSIGMKDEVEVGKQAVTGCVTAVTGAY